MQLPSEKNIRRLPPNRCTDRIVSVMRNRFLRILFFLLFAFFTNCGSGSELLSGSETKSRFTAIYLLFLNSDSENKIGVTTYIGSMTFGIRSNAYYFKKDVEECTTGFLMLFASNIPFDCKIREAGILTETANGKF